MPSRIARLFALLLLPALLLLGCSDDGGDGEERASGSSSGSASASVDSDGDGDGDMEPGEGDGGEQGTKSTVPNPEPPPPPDRTQYCQVWGRLVAANQVDFNDDDPNAVKGHYGNVLNIARELEGVAPLDIKGAVQVAIRETQRVVDTGNTDADDTDEARVNGKRLQDYAAEHCA